jgi:hypothetical protein
METYLELKENYSKELSEAGKKHGLFWAFTEKQFNENKTPLSEGEKYVSIGGGGYIPKSKFEAYKADLDKSEEKYEQVLKSNPEILEQGIRYELANHECWYTGDIEPVTSMFDGVATKEQIITVYRQGNEE